jgi:hypothetical protein
VANPFVSYICGFAFRQDPLSKGFRGKILFSKGL